MTRTIIILLFSFGITSCGIRTNSAYIKPGSQLEFKKNGKCIKTSKHIVYHDEPGGTKQVLGEYTITNDTIYIEFVQSRQSGSNNSQLDVECMYWTDIDHYTVVCRINELKDTIEIKGIDGGIYILDK